MDRGNKKHQFSWTSAWSLEEAKKKTLEPQRQSRDDCSSRNRQTHKPTPAQETPEANETGSAPTLFLRPSGGELNWSFPEVHCWAELSGALIYQSKSVHLSGLSGIKLYTVWWTNSTLARLVCLCAEVFCCQCSWKPQMWVVFTVWFGYFFLSSWFDMVQYSILSSTQTSSNVLWYPLGQVTLSPAGQSSLQPPCWSRTKGEPKDSLQDVSACAFWIHAIYWIHVYNLLTGRQQTQEEQRSLWSGKSRNVLELIFKHHTDCVSKGGVYCVWAGSGWPRHKSERSTNAGLVWFTKVICNVESLVVFIVHV